MGLRQDPLRTYCIQVLNLTTGAVTGSRSTHSGIGEVDNLSWVNARSLAFEWVPLIQRRDRIIYRPITRGSRPYRVLPLSAAPATDLLAASEPVASSDAQRPDFNTVPTVLVTPDGQTVVTSRVTLRSHGHEARAGSWNWMRTPANSERTLYSASATGDASALEAGCDVLSLGPGGAHPLVDCFGKAGALVNGQIVSLPGFTGRGYRRYARPVGNQEICLAGRCCSPWGTAGGGSAGPARLLGAGECGTGLPS